MIGILGGGQLGRMLALAGYPLGLRFRIFDPSPDAPAGQVAPLHVGAFDDARALDRFCEGLDVVTYEFENVPVPAAAHLASRVPAWPPVRALEAAQDRLLEKSLFVELGIPTVPFERVDSAQDLERAVARLGPSCVLKTRRLGYDGKGQARIPGPGAARDAWERLGAGSVPLILEPLLRFERELSVLAVRAPDGAMRAYPLVENRHREGILRLSLAPAPGAGPALQREAESYGARVLTALGYVGVLAIEWFVVDGRLLASEMACRVHNSGHWTIEGARTSQFENHVRAVAGLPLGSTEPTGHSGMINLIGTPPAPADALRLDGAHLHLYGKDARPGRKIGHLTFCEPTPERRDACVRAALGALAMPVPS